jgi:hypothetical protein
VTGGWVDAALLVLVAFAAAFTLARKRLHTLLGLLAPLVPARCRRLLGGIRIVETDDGTTVELGSR